MNDLKDTVLGILCTCGPWKLNNLVEQVHNFRHIKNFDYKYHVNKYVEQLEAEGKIKLEKRMDERLDEQPDIYPTEKGYKAFESFREEYYYWRDNLP